jgi:hypothetical protein
VNLPIFDQEEQLVREFFRVDAASLYRVFEQAKGKYYLLVLLLCYLQEFFDDEGIGRKEF